LVVGGVAEVWQCRTCIRIRNSLAGNEDAPRVILASRIASPDLAVAVAVDVEMWLGLMAWPHPAIQEWRGASGPSNQAQ
jgi:hypothetical protein